MNDDDFLAALEARTLPPAEFTHRSHLRAGWLYLERYSIAEAARRCALAIREFGTTAGAPGKFHLTLTLAFMHILADLRRRHPEESWEAFLAACPELERNARRIITQYYSDELLASEHARKSFVPPDRAPLPSAAPNGEVEGRPREQ